MKTLTSLPKRALGFVLVLILLAGIFFSDGIFSTAFAAENVPLTTTFKLNDVVVSGTVDVKNGDWLEVHMDLSAANPGDTYVVQLPDIFTSLNESTIRSDNENLSGDVDFAFDGRKVTLTFINKTLAAAFVFKVQLSFDDKNIDIPKTISIGGEQVITIVPKGSGGSSDGYIGPQWLPPPVPAKDMDAVKYGNSEITEANFVEDTAIGQAYYYMLLMNSGQYKKEYSATLADTLPTGMQLFIPNAPNCGTTDYAEANKSFYILAGESIFVKNTDGSYYGDIGKMGSGKASEYLTLINANEQARGRAGNYIAADLNMKIEVPQYMADSLTNGEDALVTYGGSVSLGYRINPNAGASEEKITLVVIDRSHPQGYYAPTSEPASWESADRAIPLYDRAPYKNTSICWENPYTAVEAQYAGQSPMNGVTAAYKGKTTLPGNWEAYTWDYNFRGSVLFTLTVKHNTVTGVDAFETTANVTESSFLYGKALAICPHIYFDQSKLPVPSTGEIKFTNTATYNTNEKKAETVYAYNFASGGTVITGRSKVVDKENVSLESGDNKLHYSLQFEKKGDVDIETPGALNTVDVLDANVAYVPNSIKISKYESGTWNPITTTTATNYSEAVGGDLNLKVTYSQSNHRITIQNTGVLSFAGKIKIEFDVVVNDEAYGAQILNYFGTTAETFVDHKIAINKVDDNEAPINSAAVFAIQYTTATDYEKGILSSLTSPDGSAIGDLTTANGVAETLYRLEDETFYLKITEKTAPSGYRGINGAIWVKAARDTVTNKMTYTLADAPDGVSFDVTGGVVEITVPNTLTVLTSTTATLKAKKTANVSLEAGKFRFALLGADGKVIELATNKADGFVDFTALSYDTAGTYNYTIRECGLATDTAWTIGQKPPASVSPSKDGWSFDATAHRVQVMVKKNGDALEATVVYRDIMGDQTVPAFHNTYTPPTNPGDGNVTLRIRKQLSDENGNAVGTGKKFVVRLYDSSKNMIRYIVLDANGGEAVIEGLDSGTIYYLQEDSGNYILLGYEIVGIGEATSKAIGFRVPKLAEGQTRTLEIIVKNSATPDELIEIPNEDPPLVVVPPLGEDLTVIEIPNKNAPLTGDMFALGLIITVMAAAAGIGLGCVLTRKKPKNTKK